MKGFLQILSLGIIAIASGCATPVSNSVTYAPNYDTPDSQFVPVKVQALAPDFRDEYAGKYVVFDGAYLSRMEQALIGPPGDRPFIVSDFRTAMIGGPGMATAQPLHLIYHIDDRELGRPFVELQALNAVKIYAYVVPARTPFTTKSQPARISRGFPIPVVVLIKAVPTSAK